MSKYTIIMTMKDGSRKARMTTEKTIIIDIFRKFKNCVSVETAFPADHEEKSGPYSLFFDRNQFNV